MFGNSGACQKSGKTHALPAAAAIAVVRLLAWRAQSPTKNAKLDSPSASAASETPKPAAPEGDAAAFARCTNASQLAGRAGTAPEGRCRRKRPFFTMPPTYASRVACRSFGAPCGRSERLAGVQLAHAARDPIRDSCRWSQRMMKTPHHPNPPRRGSHFSKFRT